MYLKTKIKRIFFLIAYSITCLIIPDLFWCVCVWFHVGLSRPGNAPFILLLLPFGIRFQTASVTYIRFLSSKSNLKLIFFVRLFWIHRCNLFVFIVCALWVLLKIVRLIRTRHYYYYYYLHHRPSVEWSYLWRTLLYLKHAWPIHFLTPS